MTSSFQQVATKSKRRSTGRLKPAILIVLFLAVCVRERGAISSKNKEGIRAEIHHIREQEKQPQQSPHHQSPQQQQQQQQQERKHDSLFSIRFLKTNNTHNKGASWSIFDKFSTTPLYSDRGFKCRWANYTSQYASDERSAPICVHPERDLISNRIFNTNHWYDCISVSRQYHSSLKETTRNGTMIMPVHLEIGANIGGCLVELLLSNPDVHVIAFEPFPANVFCLTSTLLKNPGFQRRVTVYPVALGKKPNTIKMEMEMDVNLGSARIQASKDAGGVERAKTSRNGRVEVNIAVEKIDDLIAVDGDNNGGEKPIIPFAKMDVQGYECYVIDGMSNLLPHLSRLITEVEGHSLLQFEDCSSVRLLERIENDNRNVLWYRGSGRLMELPRNVSRLDFNAVGIRKDLYRTPEQ